jgi:hypothetical protein
MSRKLIIKESQLVMLTKFIEEGTRHESCVKRVVDDLNSNYTPAVGTFKKGGEYHDTQMITNEVDGELIEPAALLDYLKYKYEYSDEFLKQVMNDWYSGKLKNSYVLSKNVKV